MRKSRSIALSRGIVDATKYPVSAGDKAVSKAILSFMDMAASATNRATAYNTKDQQKTAVESLHTELFKINRGIYTASLLLEGLTDYNIEVGVRNLLANTSGRDESMLTLDTETKAIALLITRIPVQRMLDIFLELREKRINNARSRKVILLALLGSDKLEYWSVKYRKKIKASLEHAWGKRTAGIVTSISSKARRTEKEKSIMQENVHRFSENGAKYVDECVAFIFGNKTKKPTLPVLQSFVGAKRDIEAGSKLPREVLEGIRGTYHKGTVTTAQVLELTKKQLTGREAMKTQKNAEKHGVEVEYSAKSQNAVDIYIHAYANGFDKMLKKALAEKGKIAAKMMNLSYGSVGILVDCSQSMAGDASQKMRPMAVALATRDMLMHVGDKAEVVYVGGDVSEDLPIPQGETDLAGGLIQLMKNEPEAIFIISDGYENSPAGRVNEVIELAKKIGFACDFYQFSPVMSAESQGIKTLGESVSAMPISNPTAVGIGSLKLMIQSNPREGVMGLFDIAVGKLVAAKVLPA